MLPHPPEWRRTHQAPDEGIEVGDFGEGIGQHRCRNLSPLHRCGRNQRGRVYTGGRDAYLLAEGGIGYTNKGKKVPNRSIRFIIDRSDPHRWLRSRPRGQSMRPLCLVWGSISSWGAVRVARWEDLVLDVDGKPTTEAHHQCIHRTHQPRFASCVGDSALCPWFWQDR